MPDKAAVRAAARAARDALASNDIEAGSRLITARVEQTSQWESAECVGLYWPIGSEVRTEDLFAAAVAAGKIVGLPRVTTTGGNLIFHRVNDPTELVPGRFGVLEPLQTASAFPAGDLDVIVVPGLAFDVQRNRIGYGAGYYDRTLSDPRYHAWKIGVAFEAQIQPEVPADPRDVSMDCVATEDRLI